MFNQSLVLLSFGRMIPGGGPIKPPHQRPESQAQGPGVCVPEAPTWVGFL